MEAIAKRFGVGVLAPDGGVDRMKLARIVFGAGEGGQTSDGRRDAAHETRDARRDLEAIIHPLVRQRLLDFAGASSLCDLQHSTPHTRHHTPPSPPLATDCRLPTTNLKLSVIPLLYESHFESDYDIILCVTSSEDRQIERMMRTRGYTQAQAEARLAAQMPVCEKAARADRIIQNDSTPEELKAEVQRCVAWLSEKMG